MRNNTQSRKWSLVINNPKEYGMSHETIIGILARFSPQYFCMADEIGNERHISYTYIFVLDITNPFFNIKRSPPCRSY